MKTADIAVVGAGPAGLSAAIEAARAGAGVLLIDENARPGGQLFKQIHKFFGSREHRAGIRGMDIGTDLLDETGRLGIEVWLDSEVCGIYDGNGGARVLWVVRSGRESRRVRAARVVLATGATENAVQFPGWTLPGVMGAGAAQTMINVHRVLPGRRVLMVGSGNVGLIVSYQLLQAGAEVAAVVEVAPRIGGYAVHSAKLRRAGVPFFVGHTVARAAGVDRADGRVASALIVRLDERWQPVPGSELELAVDTICLATGLTPLAELAWIAGARFEYLPELGGHLPWHDRRMQTSAAGIYVAGDITGVEEASTAMEEGRLAGIGAAASLGHLTGEAADRLSAEVWRRLDALRSGPFGLKRRQAKEKITAAGRPEKE